MTRIISYFGLSQGTLITGRVSSENSVGWSATSAVNTAGVYV